MQSNILLVEDNDTLGYMLKEYLEMKGLAVHWVTDGQQGFQAFEMYPFDLCVLDVMMPVMDGYTLAKKIKNINAAIPIIFLTAKSLKIDVLKAFSLGADDYIKKPVDEEELLVRIQAVLNRVRREQPAQAAAIRLGKYTFDYGNQQLKYEGAVQVLTKREADILRLLCGNMGNLTSRTQMLKSLWGKSDYFNRKSMDVFISRLRKYLAKDERVQIENVHGSGFILNVDELPTEL